MNDITDSQYIGADLSKLEDHVTVSQLVDGTGKVLAINE